MPDDEKKKDEMKESKQLKAENDLLKRELAVLQECADAKIEITPVKKKALLALREADDRKALIDEFKAALKTSGNYAKSTGPLVEREPDFEDQYSSVLSRLTGRQIAAATKN